MWFAWHNEKKFMTNLTLTCKRTQFKSEEYDTCSMPLRAAENKLFSTICLPVKGLYSRDPGISCLRSSILFLFLGTRKSWKVLRAKRRNISTSCGMVSHWSHFLTQTNLPSYLVGESGTNNLSRDGLRTLQVVTSLLKLECDFDFEKCYICFWCVGEYPNKPEHPIYFTWDTRTIVDTAKTVFEEQASSRSLAIDLTGWGEDVQVQ